MSGFMIETKRLLIRKMVECDLDDIYAMRSDADVMRYIREPQERKEALRWIKLVNSKWDTDSVGICAVSAKETGQFIGWCGLWVLQETDEIEIGYAVAKPHWRKGYAFEAAEGVLEYGFKQLGLPKIVACANPNNRGSRRVMEKLGMTFDHIGFYYGRDLVHYTINKDDYFRN